MSFLAFALIKDDEILLCKSGCTSKTLLNDAEFWWWKISSWEIIHVNVKIPEKSFLGKTTSWQIIIFNDYSSQKLRSLISHELYTNLRFLFTEKGGFQRVFAVSNDKLGSPQHHRVCLLHVGVCNILSASTIKCFVLGYRSLFRVSISLNFDLFDVIFEVHENPFVYWLNYARKLSWKENIKKSFIIYCRLGCAFSLAE